MASAQPQQLSRALALQRRSSAEKDLLFLSSTSSLTKGFQVLCL